MRLLPIIFIILHFSSISAQEFLWTKQFSDLEYSQGDGIEVDQDGNSYVLGRFEGEVTVGDSVFNMAMDLSFGANDIFIAKFDKDGQFLWARQGKGIGRQTGSSIDLDNFGNVYITGSFTDEFIMGDSSFVSKGREDIYIVKYDTEGNFIWALQDGGTFLDFSDDLTIDLFGNIYIAGSFSSQTEIGNSTFTSIGSFDVFLAKYDSDGNFIWAKKGGGTEFDSALGIITDRSGNVYFTGNFESTATFGDSIFTADSGWDLFLVKYNSAGTFLWALQGGGIGNDRGHDLAVGTNNDVFLTGSIGDNAVFGDSMITTNNLDIFTARLSPEGEVLWLNTLGTLGNEEGRAIKVDEDDNSYITGLFPANGFDIFISKYDSEGNRLYVETAVGPGNDGSSSLGIDALQNVYITGFTNDTTNFGDIPIVVSEGESSAFIAKFGNPEEPIPTIGEWGVVVMILLFLIVGLYFIKLFQLKNNYSVR